MNSEKENFLRTWNNEFQTTLKVIKAFPSHRENFKPHELSRSAKELAWTIVGEERAITLGVASGKIDFSMMANAPENMKDLIEWYEKSHKEMVNEYSNLSEEELNKTMKFSIGPKQVGDFRKLDLLWMILMDAVHHRGQFSVYLRMAGGKVPSIYGPTADEPWN